MMLICYQMIILRSYNHMVLVLLVDNCELYMIIMIYDSNHTCHRLIDNLINQVILYDNNS